MNFNTFSQAFSLFDLAVQTYQNEKGLIGIDTGYRFVDKKPSNQLAVRVHFFDRDPGSLEKPPGGQAIQLLIYPKRDQPKTGPIPPWNQYKKLVGPGLSFGCFKSRGSIGLLGRDTKRGNVRAILSCQHIFKKCLQGSGFVYQPLPNKSRGTLITRRIGKWNRRLPNSDAAIIHVKPTRKRLYRNQVKIGQGKVLQINNLRRVQLGDILIKAGSSTGITRARVDGIGLFFPQVKALPFSIPSFRLVPLKQDMNSPLGIAAGGDSGAVWVDVKTGDGVGLHIAGNLDRSTPATFAYALHLEQICNDIGFRLLA